MTMEVCVFYRDSTCEILSATDAEHVREILARTEQRCTAERKAASSRYAWERAWIDTVTVLHDGKVVVTAEIKNNDTAPIIEQLRALGNNEGGPVSKDVERLQRCADHFFRNAARLGSEGHALAASHDFLCAMRSLETLRRVFAVEDAQRLPPGDSR